MNNRTIAVNGIIAALYIAVTAVIQPLAFGAVQFRIPEMFNHLVVFNKKFFFGVVLGVFFANLFFSTLLPYDLIFGVFHTVFSLAITMFICRFVKNIWGRMVINSFVFSFMIFIVAYELNLAIGLPFWETWLFTAVGEFVVMAIGIPIIYAINKQVNFDKILK